jgi:transcriptional regulator with XRE-family HTH domain
MPDEPENQLGHYLREKREAAGLSIRAAARKAGFSEGRWRQLERGYQPSGGERIPANPRPSTVVQAADALGADAEEALKVAGLDADVAEVRRELEETDLAPIEPPATVAAIAGEAVSNGTLQQVVLTLMDLLTPDEMGKIKLALGFAEMRAAQDRAELQKEGVVDPGSLRDLDAITPDGRDQAEALNAWADLLNAHHFYSSAYARADLAQQRASQLRRLLEIDASASTEALCDAAEKTLKEAVAEAREMLSRFRNAEEVYDRITAKDQGE